MICLVLLLVALRCHSLLINRRVLEHERGYDEIIKHLHAYQLHDFRHSTRRSLANSNQVYLDLVILDLNLTLELTKHDQLFHPSYKHYFINEKNERVEDKKNERIQDCVYRGHVKGAATKTKASVVLCYDLVHASIHLAEGDTITIQPLESGQLGSYEHVVYYHRDLKDNDNQCGNEEVSVTPPSVTLANVDEHYDSPKHLRSTQASNGNSAIKYVSVGIFNDYLRYQQKGPITQLHTAALFAQASLLYEKIGTSTVASQFTFQLQMKAQYTFVVQDPYDLTYDSSNQVSASNLLSHFESWQSNEFGQVGTNGPDVFHLYSGNKFEGITIGLAHTGQVCNTQLREDDVNSGANVGSYIARSSIIQANSMSDAQMSSTSAHEIGHNLGAEHTNIVTSTGQTCDPPPSGKLYIMAAASSQANTDWSTCTIQWFYDHFKAGSGLYNGNGYMACLETPDSNDFQLNTPVCGNGMVENGEQCDCPDQDCSLDPCCEGATCQLKPGNTCSKSDGICCLVDSNNVCSIQTNNQTLCRASSGVCDFPEYCDGVNRHCPKDSYATTGSTCITSTYKVNGTCYYKQCLDVKEQCELSLSTWVDVCPGVRNDNACSLKCYSQSKECEQFSSGPSNWWDGTQCAIGHGCYQGKCIPFATIPLPNCNTTNITQIGSVNCGDGLSVMNTDQAPLGDVLDEINLWISQSAPIYSPILAIITSIMIWYLCLPRVYDSRKSFHPVFKTGKI